MKSAREPLDVAVRDAMLRMASFIDESRACASSSVTIRFGVKSPACA